MPEDNGICAKAKLFFEKADEAAANYNFDYAIDLYLQGLRCNPDVLQDGHLQLRELALRRQAKGGKKPSIMERMKYSRGKNPLEQLLNAEYLMARDPEHLPYIEAMLKAAVAGGYNQTAKWIADLLFAANNASQSPSPASSCPSGRRRPRPRPRPRGSTHSNQARCARAPAGSGRPRFAQHPNDSP